MYEIIIRQPGRDEIRTKLIPGVYRVGASPASHLTFKAEGIIPRHCQLIVSENDLKIQDLGGGITVDGESFREETVSIRPGSSIMIGTVEIVALGTEAEEAKKSIFPIPRQEKAPEPPAPAARMELSSPGTGKIPLLQVSGIPPEARAFVQEVKRQAHAELLKRLNVKRMLMTGTDQKILESKARETIHEIMQEINVPLPDGVTSEKIERELVHEAIGLGPLEDLIAMPEISEIMVNGPDSVYVETKGVLHKTDMAFADNQQVLAAIERIVSPLGRRIDESSPMVDARLKDGSRVNAIIPPLSLVGPTITIRKFSKTPLQIDNLVQFGSISYPMAKFLDICVKLRKNIIISGGTGSGKTTLLNVLSQFIPLQERLVTIEDSAELKLSHRNLVRLESRPANIEGRGRIAIRDLLVNALRMRPDRIIIGECRSGEALDMLQAMNTGHDGSLTTVHANSPRDALSRLENMVLMAGYELPVSAIREQVASAIQLIIQQNRLIDGTRKITQISEVVGREGNVITMQDIFLFEQEGLDADGRVRGYFTATGNVPHFVETLRQRGRLKLDMTIFAKNARFPVGGKA